MCLSKIPLLFLFCWRFGTPPTFFLLRYVHVHMEAEWTHSTGMRAGIAFWRSWMLGPYRQGWMHSIHRRCARMHAWYIQYINNLGRPRRPRRNDERCE
jgi:hypothetical protein